MEKISVNLINGTKNGQICSLFVPVFIRGQRILVKMSAPFPKRLLRLTARLNPPSPLLR